MRYKIGDKVRVRSWQSMLKQYGTTEYGNIAVPGCFTKGMSEWCGKIVTIKTVTSKWYRIFDDEHVWSDEMFCDNKDTIEYYLSRRKNV